VIRICLPFPPSSNHLFANGAKGHGRHRTAQYKAWEHLASLYIKDSHRINLEAYTIAIALNPPDKRARDLDNFVKGISDLLVSHGVVKDDSYCRKLVVVWNTSMDEECVVVLHPAEEDMAC
jgi:crossover junction endodeoxyribonuclease RusA